MLVDVSEIALSSIPVVGGNSCELGEVMNDELDITLEADVFSDVLEMLVYSKEKVGFDTVFSGVSSVLQAVKINAEQTSNATALILFIILPPNVK